MQVISGDIQVVKVLKTLLPGNCQTWMLQRSLFLLQDSDVASSVLCYRQCKDTVRVEMTEPSRTATLRSDIRFTDTSDKDSVQLKLS